jgi:phosphatidylethanolamine-binding protein
MISLSVSTVLALIPFTFAQSTNAGVGIEGIEANFVNAGLVPSLLATFNPSAVMNFAFGNGDIAPGTPLTQER